jgi:hypothetical protein
MSLRGEADRGAAAGGPGARLSATGGGEAPRRSEQAVQR